MNEFRRIDLQLFAGEGDPAPEPGNEPTGGDQIPDESGEPSTSQPTNEKMLPQSAVNAIVAREVRKALEKQREELEAERKKAAMTEAERLKAEKEEAERKAQEAQALANQRLINAEAKLQAVSLGVRPERIAYVLKLADISDVEVDDNGIPDVEAIKEAIEAVIKDLPELKGTQNPSKSGSEFNSGNKTKSDTDTLRRAMGLF